MNRNKQARLWWPNNYYDVSLSYSNGTYFEKFGNFLMRVSTNSVKTLNRQMGNNWWHVAMTHDFNHYTLQELNEVKFLMSPNLFVPATPFS